MIQFEYIEDEQKLKDVCQVGIDSHLHTSGKMLDWYEEGDRLVACVLAREEGTIVGIATIINSLDDTFNNIKTNVGFYVRPSHRRLGIGTLMGNILCLNYCGELFYWIESQKDSVRKSFFTKALGERGKVLKAECV